MASKVQMEMLEQRIMLAGNPIAPPPLPNQPTPLQGVVGTPNSLDPILLNGAFDFNALSYNIGGVISRANGAGQTIAIVDAYGSPTIVNDAETFDAETYLAPGESSIGATTGGITNYDAEGNFFLSVVKLNPTVNTIVGDATDQAGWSKETSLDVEWAHAVAPGAHILLVEAASDQALDLLDADVYAAQLPGVVAVSDSFGGDVAAQPYPAQTLDGYLVTPTGHTDNNGMTGGVVFLASSGDNYGVDLFPAASRNVLSVGGETDTIDLNDVIENIGPWHNGIIGSGGGNSTTAPTYNDPLIALDAAPETGVWIYDSTPDLVPGEVPPIQGGWSVIGGTSFACPAWAATIAIIDQGLNLRGFGSMNNEQVLGDTPYDDRTFDPGPTIQTTTVTGAPPVVTVLGDPAAGFGILGLAENDSATNADFIQLPGGKGGPEAGYPLWGHTVNSVTNGNTTTTTTSPSPGVPVPDITVTPVADFTGWGMPNNDSGNIGSDAFNPDGSPNPALSARGGFIQDMVGGAVGLTFLSNTVDSLYFTQQPVNTQAGSTINSTSPGIQVTAFYGNTGTPNAYGVDTTFTGATHMVTINILEAGTLMGTLTATPVNGVATFSNLSIDQVGTYEFSASSPNVNPAISNAFNITATVATKLVVTEQPASFWQYAVMQSPIMVIAEDRFGNLSYFTGGNKVTMSILTGPPGGALTGLTTATMSNGISAFGGIGASLPGTYVLVFRSGSLTPAIANPFAEVPIPVTERFTFNGAPLSSNAILFQQFRNAQVYTSQGPPSNTQVQQVIAMGNVNLNFLSQLDASGAAPAFAAAASASTVSPFASGDSASSSNLESQLLDSGSGDNKLLD
ncbi:MAG: LEPR-XLL domain-containing protein [Tepidisphaeraceae bacterium]